MSSSVVEARVKAVEEAVKLVERKRPRVLGLGSGTTMRLFIDKLAEYLPDFKREVLCVPTSHDIAVKARQRGFVVLDPVSSPDPGLTIDSADEVDSELNLLKGGGGALTLEKIIAKRSKQYIVVVDDRKVVDKLCTAHPIPVEVLPPAWQYVANKLERILPISAITLREGTGKLGPLTTDLGNFILDVKLSEPLEPNEVAVIEKRIKGLTGVVEVGLFPSKIVSKVILGYASGVKALG